DVLRPWMRVLGAHLARRPYLFGERPSLADFALFGGNAAHFTNDPLCRRWVEEDGPAIVQHTHRLLEPEEQAFGAWDDPAAVPDTLTAVLAELGKRYLPWVSRACVDGVADVVFENGARVAVRATWSRGVQDAIVTRIAQRRIGRNMSGLLAPDALRVLLCGTASPIPSPRRAEACTAVFAGGRMWIVDTGPGSWRTLALRRVRGEAIGAVFYTHLHSDHIGELGEFNLQTWAAGRPGPLRVYGPDGVTDLVHGFAQAYAADTRFRVAHHGAELLPPDRAAMIPIPVLLDGADAIRVLDEDGVVVTAFAVAHDPVKPAFGYRFDYGGRSVVLSGDTRPCPNLMVQA